MRVANSLTTVVVALIITVGAVAGIFIYMSGTSGKTINVTLPGQSTTSTTTTPAVSCSGKSASIFTLTFGDPLAGGSTSPTTVKVVPDSGVSANNQVYSGTVAAETVTVSSGSGNTGIQYPCGAGLSIYEVLSGSETLYWHVTAPGATQSEIQGKNYEQVGLSTFTNPALSISIKDDKGNIYTSGTTIANFTNSGHCTTNNKCLGESSITFTISVTNTAANSAWASSQDPTNGNQNWCNAVLMKENGTNTNIVSMAGFPSNGAITVGSTRYWQATIPDQLQLGASNPIVPNTFANLGYSTNCAQYVEGIGGFSTQTQSGARVGGSWTFSFTVSQGSLVHGNTLTLTPSFYYAYDPAYAASHSASGGTNAAQWASAYFHLKLAA